MSTVLVTGANRGIGIEFVRQYAADGARVLACARVPGAATELLDIAAKSKGKVTVHPLDVASAASIDHLVQELDGQPIDILINNAGVYGGDHQTAHNLDYETWNRTLAVNSIGPVRVLLALLPNLKKGKDKKAIAITSGMGSTTNHDGAALIYRSSKAALNNAMHGLSLSLRPDGIIVLMVHPGWVKTDMGGRNASLSPDVSVAAQRKLISALTPKDTGRYLAFDGREIPW
ncbi:MAG: SDR family NAD(P)-dependent oxidoreductase [Alphaproteobacteria bacterium]|nr:SDR family NAD(P)-dependent oxidoreductase [Alphaproteobacteria bacterium]